jgi:BolA protein
METTRAQRIYQRLAVALRPEELNVEDQSARHAGHAGASPEGESHFLVTMVADGFAGLSRLERQRLVHQILAEEFAGGLHALRLRLRAPGEER